MLGQPFAHRRLKKAPIRPAVEALEDRWLLATFTWVGPASGGDFNTAANWQDQASAPGVPGAGDDAVIAGSDTVTANQAHTLGTLQLGANAQLNIAAGTFLLRGGTVAGTLDVAGGATLSFRNNTINLNAGVSLTGDGAFLVGGDAFGPTVTLNADLTAPAHFTFQNGTLNGSGDLTIPAGTTFTWKTASFGSAKMSGGGTTTVEAGATLNVEGNPTFNTAQLDGRTLDNFGTVNVSGLGEFQLNNGAALNNKAGGVINVQSDLTLNGSGLITNAGAVNKTSPVGTGTTTLGVTLNNTGTVHVVSGNLALSGGGTNSGTLTADAGAKLTFPNVFSTYTLNAGSQFTGAGLFNVTGGTVALAGGAAVSNLQLDGGTVNGTGPLTPGTFTWNLGTLAAPTVIPNGATLTLATGGGKNLNGDLTNNGTVNVTSTSNVGLGNTPTITNNGAFNLQSDKDLSGNALFQNAGTLTKSSPTGTGTSQFGPEIVNTGTVTAQSGVLRLRGGGTGTGAWTAAAGGTIDFNGGTYELATGTTFTGDGVIQVTSFGNLQVTGTVTAENFTHAGGNLSGTGTFTVTDTLTWTGGSVNGSTTVSIPAGAALLIQGNADKSLGDGRLMLAGATTWKDGGDLNVGFNGVIDNLAGATFTVQDTQVLGGGKFNNAGTLIRTGTGTTGVSVFNTFTNTGTISVQGGTFEFHGDLVQNAGATTIAAGATLHVGSFSGEMKLNGGTLSGTGTLNGRLTSAGTVAPGSVSSAGTLTVTGNYTQKAGGTLAINVGGTTPDSGFSRLVVGGSATLAGVLSLNSINSFTAALGNTFAVATFQSRTGTLAVGGNLNPGGGNQFSASPGATSFTVAVTQIPLPPPPPPPPPPAPPAPLPVGVSLLTRRVGAKKKLMAQVAFSGGLAPRTVTTPFQQPAFRGSRVALHDSNGDGMFDSLLFSARKGTKKVSRIVAL